MKKKKNQINVVFEEINNHGTRLQFTFLFEFNF